jgi:hypothetical protein
MRLFLASRYSARDVTACSDHEIRPFSQSSLPDGPASGEEEENVIRIDEYRFGGRRD